MLINVNCLFFIDPSAIERIVSLSQLVIMSEPLPLIRGNRCETAVAGIFVGTDTTGGLQREETTAEILEGYLVEMIFT